MSKKKWKKPQLVVLARGREEENVMAGCKIGMIPGSINATHLWSCAWGTGSLAPCTACNAQPAS